MSSEGFALLLDPVTGDSCRVVAGLPLALRLALDAQHAGASSIVVASDAADVRRALGDSRLRIVVASHVPKGARVLRVPANFVVHRALFKSMLEQLDWTHRASARYTARDAASGSARDDSAHDSAVREPPALVEGMTVDAPYAFAALPVMDTASAREAERRLFRALRKPQDGWTSRYLNRYVSLAISRGLVHTPLKPNQLSLGILGVGLVGAWIAARGGYGNLLWGAFLFQTQSVLDGCDGELSRVTHRGSLTGEWLDTVGDDVTNYGFFAGAALGLYRTSHQPLYLLAGAITVVAGVISSGLEYRYLIKIGSGDLLKYPLSQGQANPGQASKLAFLQPLFKRDTFVFLTLGAAALSLLGPMLCVFAAAAVGILLSVIKTELRLARAARPRGARR